MGFRNTYRNVLTKAVLMDAGYKLDSSVCKSLKKVGDSVNIF